MSKVSVRQIKAIDHFKRRFGTLTPYQRQKVRRVLREFHHELRPILGTSVRSYKAEFPEERTSPCATCALNPKTFRMKGFVGTTYGLIKALLEVKPFLCHRNQSRWRENIIDLTTVELCTGFYAVLVLQRNAVWNLAQNTVLELEKIVKPRRGSRPLVRAS